MDNQLKDKLPVKPACYYCQSYNIDIKNRCKFCDYGRIHTDKYTKYILGDTGKGEE